MNKRGLFLLAVLLIISVQISAQCDDGQIDINSASAEELDGLSGVGPVYAQRIIDDRPYSSVDGLLEIKGIGNVTLSKIKSQGLACVSGEDEEDKAERDAEEEIIEETSMPAVPSVIIENIKADAPITAEAILLNSEHPKDIKTKGNALTSDTLAIYGLAGFCVLLGVLFGIRKIKKPKTEFQT